MVHQLLINELNAIFYSREMHGQQCDPSAIWFEMQSDWIHRKTFDLKNAKKNNNLTVSLKFVLGRDLFFVFVLAVGWLIRWKSIYINCHLPWNRSPAKNLTLWIWTVCIFNAKLNQIPRIAIRYREPNAKKLNKCIIRGASNSTAGAAVATVWFWTKFAIIFFIHSLVQFRFFFICRNVNTVNCLTLSLPAVACVDRQ